MINRDGSESNGYMRGTDILEDLDAYGPGCWTFGDGIAKEFGVYYFIRHKIERILKVLYLRIKIRNYYYLKEWVEE